jgi:hypothetical protein
VRAMDLTTGQVSLLASSGAPLAWSSDDRWLVVRGGDGAPILLDTTTLQALRFALPPVTMAGWVPPGPVAWMAGAGLELLTAGDPPMLTPVLDGSVAVAAVTARADGVVMVLADRGDGMRAYSVALVEPRVQPEPAGPVLALPRGTSFAWAPDGRNVAMANGDGLFLLDTATGAVVPAVGRSARDPRWGWPTR